MTIRNLDGAGIDGLFETFAGAFADYPVQIGRADLEKMLLRRGYDPAVSFGAFDGDRLAAFTLNSTGMFEGSRSCEAVPTAYDTGTGTLPDYRGQGLAARIFEHSLPFLRQRGIGQYLLEVLQKNTTAYNIYIKQGFRVVREFDCFSQERTAIAPGRHAHDGWVTIRRVELTAELLSTRESSLASMWDYVPSWQNGLEAIRRRLPDFVMLEATANGEPAGYCIFAPNAGDITQLAVAHGHRRKGVGSALLEEALGLIPALRVKLLNAESGRGGVAEFMHSANIPFMAAQFEMIMEL